MKLIATVLAATLAIGLAASLAAAGVPGEDSPSASTAGPGPRVPIDTIILRGPSKWVFTAEGDYDYDSTPGNKTGGPCMTPSTDMGFTPADEGWYDANTNGVFNDGEQGDIFDGGFFLEINGKLFNDHDGALNGTQLKTSDTLAGLKVSRSDRALDGTRGILRDLIIIKNPKSKAKTVIVTIDSSMGADNDEATRASSDGNTSFETSDRWAVVSDSDPTTATSDSVATFVMSGKHAPGISRVVYSPDDDSSADCEGGVVYRYRVRVPANGAAAVLGFVQQSADIASAETDSAIYNKTGLSSDLLAGVPDKVRPKIVNWSL